MTAEVISRYRLKEISPNVHRSDFDEFIELSKPVELVELKDLDDEEKQNPIKKVELLDSGSEEDDINEKTNQKTKESD